MTQFWKLKEDMSSNRLPWELGAVHGIDNWRLVSETKAPEPPPGNVFHIDSNMDGIGQDYWRSGYAGVPVLSPKARGLFETLTGVKTLPARIGSHPYQGYAILFVSNFLDCVNMSKSELSLFEKDDPIRPDLAGHIKYAIRVLIDAEKTQGCEIFRLSNGKNFLFVSDRIKKSCEALGLQGCAFDPA